MAVLGKEKIILQQLGSVAKSKPANQARDFARHLHKRGFMLNVPISWLKHVLGVNLVDMFNLFFHVLVFLLVVLDMIPYTFFPHQRVSLKVHPTPTRLRRKRKKPNPSPNAEHLRYGKISFGFRTVFGKTP